MGEKKISQEGRGLRARILLVDDRDGLGLEDAGLPAVGGQRRPAPVLPGRHGGRQARTGPGRGVEPALRAGAYDIHEEAKIAYPILAFSETASGLGHANLYTESDGVLRREAPLVKYGGELYPSFATRLTMAYLGLKIEDLKFEPGVALTMGTLRVPLDDENRMAVLFNGPQDTIRVVPFANLMAGKVGADFFKDKIVILGLTASGLSTQWNTPVAQGFPALEVAPNIIANILHRKFLTRPLWAEQAEFGLLAFIGLFIMPILPRLKALWGLVVSIFLAFGLFGAGTYLFMNGQWLKIGYPSVLLFAGYLVIISKSFLVTEKGKELVEASAIETNKMLGLSFQGQGMLDIAFEKFRLCPLDDNMKDTLYNLALDFERKRQYSKAAAVFEHIAAKDPKYKDVVEERTKLKEASEGAVFGGVGGAKKEGTVMLSGGCDEADARPLRDREGAGPRRHGRRLSGPRSQDQPHGRHQDHDARGRLRRRKHKVRSRSASSARPNRPARSITPTSSASSTPATRTTSPTSRWSCSTARPCEVCGQRTASAADREGARVRRDRRRRARLRARAGHRPPRHQARQHHAS